MEESKYEEAAELESIEDNTEIRDEKPETEHADAMVGTEEMFVPELPQGNELEEVIDSSASQREPVQQEQVVQQDLAIEAVPQTEERAEPKLDCPTNKVAARKRKRRNPFIAFFLSMYSRRPRKRAADVARQAGRQWCRMTDRQRSRYAAMAAVEDWRRDHVEKR